MNKKIVAMSAMSLVLSMSFANSGYAEDSQAAAPATEPATDTAAATSAEKAVPEKGGVTKKMLDEVSVTATREARSTREVPQSIAVVGKDKIEKKRMFNLKEALEGIPACRPKARMAVRMCVCSFAARA